MFHRYTERGRRIIFFSRWEASQYGSLYIEPEHLLLGLMREEKILCLRLLPNANYDTIREQISARTPRLIEEAPNPVDLPLGGESKRILAYAVEEADTLAHRHIGGEHILLGLLREGNCFAAHLLRDLGLALEGTREKVAQIPNPRPTGEALLKPLQHGGANDDAVDIHGSLWLSSYVRVTAERLKEYLWTKKLWTPKDVVIHRPDGLRSLDLALAGDSSTFELVKGGLKEDHCSICSWALTDSDTPEHSVGYTNGRDWLCSECCERFIDSAAR